VTFPTNDLGTDGANLGVSKTWRVPPGCAGGAANGDDHAAIWFSKGGTSTSREVKGLSMWEVAKGGQRGFHVSGIAGWKPWG
jgi:hypothetical protein